MNFSSAILGKKIKAQHFEVLKEPTFGDEVENAKQFVCCENQPHKVRLILK